MVVNKWILPFVLIFLLTGCQLNIDRGLKAAADMVKAEQISDQDAIDLGAKTVAYEDKKNTVLSIASPYGKRLARITKKLTRQGTLVLNFKVYKTPEINAFATGDGSVRVYSGLMDLMNDDELFFVIGHEIGHVIHGDTKAAIKTAYRISAARKATGSLGSEVALLADSQLGNISEALLNAKFSRAQESAADKNGAALMKKYGKKKASAVSALRKLESSGGAFSSHPGSEERARAIEAMPNW